jgi:hypothetical protein
MDDPGRHAVEIPLALPPNAPDDAAFNRIVHMRQLLLFSRLLTERALMPPAATATLAQWTSFPRAST